MRVFINFDPESCLKLILKLFTFIVVVQRSGSVFSIEYISFFFLPFLWSLATQVQSTSLSLLTRLLFSLTDTFLCVVSFLLTCLSVACFMKCGTISTFVVSTTMITCVLDFGGIPVISRKASFVFFSQFFT